MEPQLLNLKQMQELLPDYAFGRVSENDKTAFEFSLPEYPEIQNELEDIRAVFKRVDEIEFEAMIEQSAKNLSVKVQQRLNNKPKSSPRFLYFSRVVLPVVGMFAIVAYLFVTGDIKNIDKNSAANTDSPKQEINILNEAEAMTIVDEETPDSSEYEVSLDMSPLIAGCSDIQDPVQDELDAIFDEFLSESLAMENSEMEVLAGSRIFQGFSIDEINDFSEDEFQELMKAIENEDFKS